MIGGNLPEATLPAVFGRGLFKGARGFESLAPFLKLYNL